MTLRRAVIAALLAALVALLAGCNSAGEKTPPAPSASPSTYGTTTPGSLKPGDPIPVPTGRPILTLTGVPTTNVGDTLQFDLATLEKFDTVAFEVFDRQAEGHDVTFSGPLLKTVLAAAGVTDLKGKTLHCLALNDYSVDIPANDAAELPVLLATRADGKKMSVAHYGPTRFIYPTEGYNLDKTKYDPRWIWQLKEISVT